jgi:diguanylate cyclase (GGDEF)-like protein
VIERPGTPLRSRADRDREIVQRTAELLASDFSPEELFSAVCGLLARFIDASVVFVALKDAQGASVAFMREDGAEPAIVDRTVRPDSQAAKVLRTGEPVLKRSLEDWTDGRLALNLPGEPHNDERVSAIFVPLQFGTEIIGVLSVQSHANEAYAEDDVALLRICAIYLSVRVHQAQLEEQSERLKNLAWTDSLTGVPNRRAFDERLDVEWKRSLRSADSMSLIMIDIDLFKTFNDTYGHVAGDAVLQQIAMALSSCATRTEDIFARYGGEEFVAVLPDTDLHGAVIVAERMREAVGGLSIVHSGTVLDSVTISAGVASLVPHDANAAHLVEVADAALYRAKNGGRNRVVAEDYRSNAPATAPARQRPENLPDLRGHTFGSPEHLTRIRKLLRTGRLLTIVGPAGIGKSRLALEAAHRDSRRYPDGIFYLDCSTLGDAHEFQGRLADLLSVPETNAVAAGSTLAEMLRTKRALIILDNCDDIAGDGASYVRLMHERARASRILATCRESLYVPGEITFGMSPLDRHESLGYFCSIAHIEPSPRAEAICVELKGIPRALELAAAQARTLDLSEIAQRLADLGSRVETAAGILDWSFAMLSPSEQPLLRAMSVFCGGGTRDAIDAVCQSAQSLPALVEKALVVEEYTALGSRFSLPASVRAVALRSAQTHGDWTTTSHKHARYFLELVRRDDPAVLAAEGANLNAALQFTIGKGNDVALGAELACALVSHWLRIARNKSGLAWIDLLMLYADEFSRELRANVLAAYAHLDVTRSKAGLDAALEAITIYRELAKTDSLAAPLFDAASAYAAHGDLARADELYEESLAIARRSGDKRRIADALMGMGLAEHYRSHWSNATELLEEALEMYRAIGDDRSAALQLGNLGDLAAAAGDYDRAVSLARQSLAIFERLRLPHWTAWQLVNLGTFELKRGELDAARPALQRGLEIVHDLQEMWFTAGALDSLARLAIATGKAACALRLTGYADSLIESLGVPRQPAEESEYRRVVRAGIEALGESAAQEQMEHGRTMPWVDILSEAMKA